MKGFVRLGQDVDQMVEIEPEEMDELMASVAGDSWIWPMRFDRNKRVWPMPPFRDIRVWFENCGG